MGFHQSCNPKGVPRQGLAHNHRDESIPGLQPSSFFQSGLALIILRRQCRMPWPNRKSPRRCEAASRLPQLEREMENREDKGRKLQVNDKHTKKGEYSIPSKQMGYSMVSVWKHIRLSPKVKCIKLQCGLKIFEHCHILFCCDSTTGQYTWNETMTKVEVLTLSLLFSHLHDGPVHRGYSGRVLEGIITSVMSWLSAIKISS